MVHIVDWFTSATSRQDFVFGRPLHCLAISYNISSVTPSHLQFVVTCMVACGVQVQSYMFIACIVISVNEYMKTYKLSIVCEHTQQNHVSRKVLSGVANEG